MSHLALRQHCYHVKSGTSVVNAKCYSLNVEILRGSLYKTFFTELVYLVFYLGLFYKNKIKVFSVLKLSSA